MRRREALAMAAAAGVSMALPWEAPANARAILTIGDARLASYFALADGVIAGSWTPPHALDETVDRWYRQMPSMSREHADFVLDLAGMLAGQPNSLAAQDKHTSRQLVKSWLDGRALPPAAREFTAMRWNSLVPASAFSHSAVALIAEVLPVPGFVPDRQHEEMP